MNPIPDFLNPQSVIPQTSEVSETSEVFLPNPQSAIRIPQSFYSRDVVTVARELLGMRLVRLLDGQRVAGIISEAEAYRGEEDQACHARAGRTRRTAGLYAPPGLAYVYFTYGMHWMMNCVCMAEGFPAAVLLRALEPVEGLEIIAANRPGRARPIWCDGPGKLAQALAIDGSFNGADLCHPGGQNLLWLEPGPPVPDSAVISGPRVGLGATPEPWLSMPWRFRKKK
jgi:DNA-3-methyladenine glycosylase